MLSFHTFVLVLLLAGVLSAARRLGCSRAVLAVSVLAVGLVPGGGVSGAPVDGTAAMVELLKEIDGASDPRRNPFLNDRRLTTIRSMIPEGTTFRTPEEEVRYLLLVGKEALPAGETDVAIRSFEKLLELVAAGAQLGQGSVDTVRHLLGVSYLRLAEEENCVPNPSADRCLLPLRGGGVHTRTRGGEKALEIYTSLLEDHPDDLRFRWLVNFAAQLVGRHPDAVPSAHRIPASAYTRGSAFPHFVDIAPQVGLDVLSQAGGSIADDFDGDGDLDLVVSSWFLGDPLRIFWNDAGRFREGASAAGLDGIGGGLNLVQADADGDGRLDILVLRGAWMGEDGLHPNSLLRNLGNGRFADVTLGAGLDSRHPTQTGAWSDFDGDGDLDLFVGNESSKLGLHRSELWRNRGDGTFEEVAQAVGIDCVAFAKAVQWDDIDDDGRPDLFVSNLGGANRLYRNLGPRPGPGGWGFEEIGAPAGVTEPKVSFPAIFLDVDQDGRTDLWVSGYRATIAQTAAEYLGQAVDRSYMPRVHRNLGGGRFEDVTAAMGMETVLATMGVGFGDLDNDGYLDIYAGTGNTPLETLMPNRMFRNVGGERFEDVTVAGGFGHLQKGHGVTFADLDQDGDQDVYAVIGGAHPADVFWNALYENPGSGNAWVRLELEGTRSNRFAVGARVRIRARDAAGTERSFWRTVGPGGSFGSNPVRLEVGLGQGREVVDVTVRWPRLDDNGGLVEERFGGLEPSSTWRLVEGAGSPQRVERPVIPFVRSDPAGHVMDRVTGQGG